MVFECISRWQKINNIDDVTESAFFRETYEYIIIYQVLDQLMAVYIEQNFKCFATSFALPLEWYMNAAYYFQRAKISWKY